MFVAKILRFKRTIVAALALALMGGVAVYYVQQARLKEQREVQQTELRAEYARLMHDALRDAYVLHGRLPEEAMEITVGNPAFRSPDMVARAGKLEGDNYPGPLGLEYLFALEERAFDDVMPIAPEEFEQWSQERRRIKDIVERAGSTEARLRLAADMEDDSNAWLQHIITLSESGKVPQELLDEYVSAARALRSVLSFSSPYVDSLPGRANAVAIAETRFEDAVKSILNELEE